MEEDPFTRPVSVKIAWFIITFVFIFIFFVISSFGEKSPLAGPAGEQAAENGATLTMTRTAMPAVAARSEHAMRQVEEKTSPPSRNNTPKLQIPASLIKRSEPFHPIIVKAASRFEVDPALVKAVIMAESGYNPQAVSSQGAKGLMQLMPKTAEALGVKDTFNPVHNVNGGVKYLKQLLEAFDDDIKLALAAYNAGSSKVRQHQGIPPIKATRYFVKKVFAYYQYYKNETTGKTDR
ncbi:MAG: lytic transglycosylase domain-containing protein [Deltaproteobacteria bacterium]|nr:lytic transglycosylase domain-containing protein [Deltaproteobacteria bacterium]